MHWVFIKPRIFSLGLLLMYLMFALIAKICLFVFNMYSSYYLLVQSLLLLLFIIPLAIGRCDDRSLNIGMVWMAYLARLLKNLQAFGKEELAATPEIGSVIPSLRLRWIECAVGKPNACLSRKKHCLIKCWPLYLSMGQSSILLLSWY